MNNKFDSLQHRGLILALGGMCWAFAACQLGALDRIPALAYLALGACSLVLLYHGYHLYRSAGSEQSAALENLELSQVARAVNQHCLISVVDQNRRLTEVNEGLLTATGYTREEMLGEDPIDFFAYVVPGQPEDILDHLYDGRSWTGETRLRCKDGTVLWTQSTIYPRYDTRGNYIGAVSIRTDISASKIAVAEREAMSILSKLEDSVYIFEPRTYKFTYMNETAMKRHGWDRSIYQTKTVGDAIKGFEPERFTRLVTPLLDRSAREVLVRANLTDGPHEVTIQLIEPENGATSFVAVFRNIREKVEIERMKDEFISTVSHELRSPITSIKGALGLLLSGAVPELPAPAKKLVDIAHRNSDRMAHLVNDILDLEKISAGRMDFNLQPECLNRVVEETIEMNAGIAGSSGVNFKFEPCAAPVEANIDADRIAQVITNLVNNAAKFSRPGSEVRISVHDEGEEARVDVRDFGAGIPEDDLEKIFDRFRQAGNQGDSNGRGTGLGLSIVRAILERHGGRVSVESELGVGSTFSVYLPRLAAPAQTETADVA